MMLEESQLMLHAHIATVDDDYEWYQIGDSICERCENSKLFMRELSRYPMDQQPLLLFSQRLGFTEAMPWMVSIGPIGTPWHDRFFGRPIRIRLAIECESEETALRIFSWGLQWWTQRNSFPDPDAGLATLPNDKQPAAVAEWLLKVKFREMLSIDLSRWLSPWRLNTIRLDKQRPMVALFGEITKIELLHWLEDYLLKFGHHEESINTSKNACPQSKLIAAVSEGIMPLYHQYTLRALGMENCFPVEWQPHIVGNSSDRRPAGRYSAKTTRETSYSSKLPLSLVLAGLRYVTASIERLENLLASRKKPGNVERSNYCKRSNPKRRKP